MTKPVSVLFVCLGNICRSPTAHGIFESMVHDANLEQRLRVDSCGTGSWHIGEPPDARATAAAEHRGYELAHLRARRVDQADFERFDHILAMDRQNLADLQAMCPDHFQHKLRLFLATGGGSVDNGVDEVPDPYYGGEQGFDDVIDLIQRQSASLLAELKPQLGVER